MRLAPPSGTDARFSLCPFLGLHRSLSFGMSQARTQIFPSSSILLGLGGLLPPLYFFLNATFKLWFCCPSGPCGVAPCLLPRCLVFFLFLSSSELKMPTTRGRMASNQPERREECAFVTCGHHRPTGGCGHGSPQTALACESTPCPIWPDGTVIFLLFRLRVSGDGGQSVSVCLPLQGLKNPSGRITTPAELCRFWHSAAYSEKESLEHVMDSQWNGAHSPPSATLRTWANKQRGVCFLSSEAPVLGILGCEGRPVGWSAVHGLSVCLMNGTSTAPPSRRPQRGHWGCVSPGRRAGVLSLGSSLVGPLTPPRATTWCRRSTPEYAGCAGKDRV